MGNKTSLTLHKAVESGNFDVLKTLLDNGGDINVQNHNGDTLLHVAVNKKNNHQSEDLVTLLLERGANPRLQNGQGNTPLNLAVEHNPKCVPLILTNGSGKDTVNIPDRWEYYPLHYATTNETVLKLLLDNGAFIECKTGTGRTPLHFASRRIHTLSHRPMELSNNQPHYNFYYDVTNQLLMHGAEVNCKDNDGRTPLHMASDIKRIRLLLDKGALVNSRDDRGYTPLHEAIVFSYDIANELLLHGADVNSKDNKGNTPLYMARKVECVRLLLDKGALVNSRNSVGETPLHNLSRYDTEKACEFLLHGADVNRKDNYGNTLFYTAFNIDCVRMLLDKGALVNSRNSAGETPLHKLSTYGRYNAYELLLYGADVNSKDNNGNTPLHTICQKESEVNRRDRTILHYLENAVYNTYFYVADILLDWGASLTTKDNKGRTPSDIYPKLLDWAEPHNVRKACIKLSDIPCEELELKSYWISCLEEVARLKLVRFGKNSLYDIFGQYSDPIFLSNEPLQKAVDINNCKNDFPIYCYLLQSTFKLAEKRLRVVEDAVDTLQTPLPREITWYILTFVDDDSLQNVIKAKNST